MQIEQLRRHYRQLRKALTQEQQALNAQDLARNIKQFLQHTKRPNKIAVYLAQQGEISLSYWMQQNWRDELFLPVLYEPVEPKVRFAPFTQNSKWKLNRFKIPEPDVRWNKTLSAQRLDIILMPLVAFDRRGGRIGMGGGYYDRTCAFRRHRKYWQRPRLVGIAHNIQEHPQLEVRKWDIPLDAVITNQEILQFNKSPI